MKRILSVLLFLFILFNSLQVSLAADNNLTMWHITDVHHLSKRLYDQGRRIQQMQDTAAGVDIFYSDYRMEALIYQIQTATDQPDYLLVSGDLTLNGEYESLLDLRGYFEQIELLGTEVLVIPGNHDINNGWSRSFSGDSSNWSYPITPQDFLELMADFGYKQADSIDEDSLSYQIRLNDFHQLILIDSNIYYPTANNDPPISYGQVKETTLEWIEESLEDSSKEGIHTSIAIHHNSISHFNGFGDSFAITNSQDLVRVFKDYEIPLALSGHIHAQNIGEYREDTYRLQDISTGAFSVYPSSIGYVKLYRNSGEYQRIDLDVEGWARSNSIDDAILLRYPSYMEEVFNRANQRLVPRENQGGPLSSPLSDELTKVLADLNLAFFAGEINEVWSELELDNSELIESIKAQGESKLSFYWKLLLSQKTLNHQNTSWNYN